jgi:hypothetical protein
MYLGPEEKKRREDNEYLRYMMYNGNLKNYYENKVEGQKEITFD